MSATVTKVINQGDSDCSLSFTLKHRMAQILVGLNSEVGSFTNVNANIQSGGQNIIQAEKVKLPLLEREGAVNGVLNTVCFQNVSGTNNTVKNMYFVPQSNAAPMTLNFISGYIGTSSLGGLSRATGKTFTLDENTSTHIFVNFKSKNYTITFNSDDRGTLAGGGTHNGRYPETVTCTATPHPFFLFDGWYKDGQKITSTSTSDDAYVEGHNLTVKYCNNGKGTYTALYTDQPTVAAYLIPHLDHANDNAPTLLELSGLLVTPHAFFYDENAEWQRAWPGSAHLGEKQKGVVYILRRALWQHVSVPQPSDVEITVPKSTATENTKTNYVGYPLYYLYDGIGIVNCARLWGDQSEDVFLNIMYDEYKKEAKISIYSDTNCATSQGCKIY